MSEPTEETPAGYLELMEGNLGPGVRDLRVRGTLKSYPAGTKFYAECDAAHKAEQAAQTQAQGLTDAVLAAPIAADEARDAARYRFLRENNDGFNWQVSKRGMPGHGLIQIGNPGNHYLDAAIDSAMATPAGSKPE